MSDTKSNKKWTDELVAKLTARVGSESPVSPATVEAAATELGVSVRSVASKLRDLGVEVASMAKSATPTFNADESAELKAFVEANANALTYVQIAEQFAEGKFTAKQVQGKLLALELTALVKPAEKVESARTYTEAQEAQLVALATKGSFLEEIAEAMGKDIASIRGKALSLTREGKLEAIPKQRDHVTPETDAFEALGDVSKLSVAEIAAKLDRTERGVKTMLTRRGVAVADYDGAKKRAKADAKAVEA
jgi:hypothetical protein